MLSETVKRMCRKNEEAIFQIPSGCPRRQVHSVVTPSTLGVTAKWGQLVFLGFHLTDSSHNVEL